MLRHIVMWNFKDGLTDIENQKNAEKLKLELEALTQSIREVAALKVYVNALASSNMDIVLDSTFESEEAMEKYKNHPEHQKLLPFIASAFQNRCVIDYYEV
jgi:lysyl-tRNA synthetase class I